MIIDVGADEAAKLKAAHAREAALAAQEAASWPARKRFFRNQGQRGRRNRKIDEAFDQAGEEKT